jgi:uncharacterized protein (TIGR02996 family)
MTKSIREFLDTVRAQPDDDDLRLVLADLYEEQGDPERAAFVRHQIERAKLAPWEREAVLLELKERALLAAAGERWHFELPDLRGVKWGSFHRGLFGKVAFDGVDVLARHAQECAEATPIYGVVTRWPRLHAGRPELARIEGLRELTLVGAMMEGDDMAWLAESPILSTVHTLNLVETQMDADALEPLLRSPYVKQLRALRLPHHNLGNEGIERLVEASLPALVDLDLSVATADDLGSGGRYEPTMDGEGAIRLSQWESFARLERLNLTGNQLGMDGLLAVLASAPRLKSLQLRGVADWDMEGDGRPSVLPAFQHAPKGLALEELDIGESELTGELARILAKSKALASLKVLRLDYVQDDGAFERLAEAQWFDSLRILSIRDSNSVTRLAALLARSPAELHTLDVSSTYDWSRRGDLARVLAAGPALEPLLSLDLACHLEHGDLGVLGKVESLPNLVELRLATGRRSGFSEKAAAAFATSPLGARLVSLELGYEGLDRLPRPALISMGDGAYRGALRHL